MVILPIARQRRRDRLWPMVDAILADPYAVDPNALAFALALNALRGTKRAAIIEWVFVWVFGAADLLFDLLPIPGFPRIFPQGHAPGRVFCVKWFRRAFVFTSKEKMYSPCSCSKCEQGVMLTDAEIEALTNDKDLPN